MVSEVAVLKEPAQDVYPFDVYICCAEEDEGFVAEEIVKPFEAAHVRYTWARDFEGGSDLASARADAIAKSRHILVVLTPAWCNCQFAKDDALSARFLDPCAAGRKILPLIYRPCDPPKQLNFDRLKRYDFLTSEVRKPTLSKMLQELGRSNTEISEVIVQLQSGLAAFVELMSSAEVRAAVRGLENAFKATNDSMGELSRCKHMHEFFHQASEQFIELSRLRDELSAAEGNCHDEENSQSEEAMYEAWDAIRAFVDEKMISSIENLLGLAVTKKYREEQLLWVSSMVRIKEELSKACDASDSNKLRRCWERLSPLLSQWTGRFDQQLSEAAKSLQLTVIVDALKSIQERSNSYNFTPEIKERIGVLFKSISAMVELNTCLQNTTVCHTCLQLVDQVLQWLTNRCRRAEDIEKIHDAWEQIEPAINRVLTLRPSGTWITQLEQTSLQMREALKVDFNEEMDAKAISQFNRAYTRFRGIARTSFTQIDLALLDMCNRLEDLQGYLNQAIQSLEK